MTYDYLYTIMQTNALEFPVYYLFMRKQFRWSDCLFVVMLANALTHPLVFFGFLGSGTSYFTSTLLAEIFAPSLEALVLILACRMTVRRAVAASLAANLVSWQIAPILTYSFFF